MTEDSKIALVTGATRGIGLETVRQLAQAGVRTLLAGRDPQRAENAAEQLRAEGLPVEAITLDVTDAASIAAATRQVAERYGRLDILVNNAGIVLDNPQAKVSESVHSNWRQTFETNVFAVVEVSLAFLPLLRQSPAGRIVNVSSILASLSLHRDPASPIYDFKLPAYGASKSALNSWTVHLAHELADTAIKVNAIHPGNVKTDMNQAYGEIEVSDGAKTSVRLALIGDGGPNGGFFHFDEALPW